MHKSISLNQPWCFLFTIQIMLAMTITTYLGTVNANAVTPEIPTASDNENELMMPEEEAEAQKWYGLKIPYGKRSVRENDYNANMMENGPMVPVVAFFANPETMEQLNESDDITDDNIYNQKRGWKKMNVAWGKRRNADMNRGASTTTGNWNNLKGMWGKRSANKGEQWNYLKGSWGKRSSQFGETN